MACFSVEFNVTNPRAMAWARERSAKMVSNINAETRRAIRTIIERAFAEGMPPAEAARLLRDVVGLTRRDAVAVANMRKRLKRDGDTKAEIDRKAKKYSEQLINRRAKMIARTETMAASNAGQTEMWRQAVDRGELPPNVQRRWLTADDEDVCPICGEPDGLSGKTAPLDGPFPGGIMDAPAHPGCRCVTVLEPAA